MQHNYMSLVPLYTTFVNIPVRHTVAAMNASTPSPAQPAGPSSGGGQGARRRIISPHGTSPHPNAATNASPVEAGGSGGGLGMKRKMVTQEQGTPSKVLGLGHRAAARRILPAAGAVRTPLREANQ
ncbi:hypothetical protein ONE63_011409 [Megalurothrips usitatus]|uniref:Uncharacterized protein n=1 Tax=Megalurothrips usitatus TaxID=439358 RepID=A0AAV7WZE2_9NEOP|nr:hypothetical protein ONE63_011409 [Megalurothrips usitatus]